MAQIDGAQIEHWWSFTWWLEPMFEQEMTMTTKKTVIIRGRVPLSARWWNDSHFMTESASPMFKILDKEWALPFLGQFYMLMWKIWLRKVLTWLSHFADFTYSGFLWTWGRETLLPSIKFAISPRQSWWLAVPGFLCRIISVQGSPP